MTQNTKWDLGTLINNFDKENHYMHALQTLKISVYTYTMWGRSKA